MATLIWAGVVLALGLIAIWRADKRLGTYLASRTKSEDGDREIEQIKHRTAAELDARTVEEASMLKRAQLQQQTVETELATARLSELQDEQLTADRRVIQARANAASELAPELLRLERAAKSDRASDLVAAYEKYMESTFDRGCSFLSFDDFAETIGR